MHRQEEKSELIYKLGLLLCLLEDIVAHPDRHDHVSRTGASGKFWHDCQEFRQALTSFTHGEPGAIHQAQWTKAVNALHSIESRLDQCLEDPETLRELLDAARKDMMAAIAEVPAFEGAKLLEAHSPFSAYCRLRDLCGSATQTLTWVDRYLDPTLFYRYMRDLPSSVKVALVTRPEGKRNASEYAALLDASRLYASQRDPADYRLVVHPGFHDRWLRCDGEIYELGGSAKDAGRATAFTLTKLEPPEDILREIERLLKTGSELYGPSKPTHP